MYLQIHDNLNIGFATLSPTAFNPAKLPHCLLIKKYPICTKIRVDIMSSNTPIIARSKPANFNWEDPFY